MKLIYYLLIVFCTLVSNIICGCLESENEQIIVSTLNDKLIYEKDELIEFNIKLLKGDKPVEGETIRIVDNLNLICAYTPKTNYNGETTYKITGKSGGQYSFLFYHNDLNTYSNFTIFINEKNIDTNFKIVTSNTSELPPLGRNVETTQETFSQKSLDVSINTIKESATNPIFLGAGALCVIGVGSSLTGIGASIGAPLAGVSCKLAYDVFMGSLLINVTRNSIKKFETDEKKKEELLNIVNTADSMQSIVSFDDVILQSPKGGKNILSYRWETPQGFRAGAKTLSRIEEVFNIVNGVSQIEKPYVKILKIGDQFDGFVCSFFISDNSLKDLPSDLETKRMVTVGFLKKRSSKGKNTRCDAEELLRKNNIKKLLNGRLDLVNKKYKSYYNENKDVTIKYFTFNGSFSKNGTNECLIILKVDGDFSHVEGFGPVIALFFDSEGKYLYEEEIGTNESINVRQVIDMDNDGISEIIFSVGGCHQGCSGNLVISKGNFKSRLLEYLIEYTYPIGYRDECVNFDCQYQIVGNSVIFNSTFKYFKKKNKKNYPVKYEREEKFTNIFELEGGKFKHKKNIENMDDYLSRKFSLHNQDCY